jgi:hypothetical protein
VSCFSFSTTLAKVRYVSVITVPSEAMAYLLYEVLQFLLWKWKGNLLDQPVHLRGGSVRVVCIIKSAGASGYSWAGPARTFFSSLIDDAAASWTGWPWELESFSSYFYSVFKTRNEWPEVKLGVSLNWVAESLDIGGSFYSGGAHNKQKHVIHGEKRIVVVNYFKTSLVTHA